MGKTKIVLNRAGVRELMQSTEMQAILVEHASKIASASDAEVYVAQTRAVVQQRGDIYQYHCAGCRFRRL